MPATETLGSRVAALRKKLGFTQIKLVELSGVSHRTLVRIELNQGSHRDDNVAKVALALGVTHKELLP